MGSLLTGSKDGYIAVEEGASCQILNLSLDAHVDDSLFITGYSDAPVCKSVYCLFTFLLGGLPWLFVQWFPKLNSYIYKKISLKDASYILVNDPVDGYSFHGVKSQKLELDEVGTAVLKHAPGLQQELRSFLHHHVKFVWNSSRGGFHALRGWDSGEKTVRQLLKESKGLTIPEEAVLLKYYGDNDIPVEVKSRWMLFTSEVIHPFYVFQLFSIVLWCLDEYHHYAICVLIITAGSIFFRVRTARQQQESLLEYVEKSRVDTALVVRPEGASIPVPAVCLVPGDVIEVPKHGCVMPCDALLLKGHCVVNESTLTGESVPVTKTPPVASDDKFDSFLFKRNTLYCGTQVMQTRYYDNHKVRAVVVNTGFCTAKGELIRSILLPKSFAFQFYEDSTRFVMALFGLAAVGIIYLASIHVSRNVEWDTIVISCLDLITIVVPPALPAAMTTGIVYAQGRLRKVGIFCTAPATINIAGKLKLFCFDKTGTLTEEGVVLWAAMPVDPRRRKLRVQYPSLLDEHDHFAVAMATCHALTRISGRLCGDPMDQCIFHAVNWELVEQENDSDGYEMLCPMIVKPRLTGIGYRQKDLIPSESGKRIRTQSCSASENERKEKPRSGSLDPGPPILDAESIFKELPYEIGIVRHFPFSSASQSMAVITRSLGADHMVFYTKGAPEKILDLCLTESIPESVNDDLKNLTTSGYRVIAVAYRKLDPKFNWRKAQKSRREDVEIDLTFLGLLVLKNNLKPNTTAVIRELTDASVRCVMVTGDNLLTAVSVSRECGMVMPEDTVVQVVVDMPADDGLTAPQLSFHPMGVIGDGIIPSPTNRHWHYAIDGRNFALLQMHLPDLVDSIVVRGTVFARMLPEQKTQLIQAFQDLNYIVGMCGDGANDCGALKMAHVGISLSEAENSVAAPFTCINRDLSCVTYLLKEGRCALVTSFVTFKYMAMYSLIQFVSVIMLHSRGIALGTVEFLFVDLVITTSLAVVIGRTGPTKILHKTRPLAKLFSVSNLLPLFLQIIVIIIILQSALIYLGAQSWFKPVVVSEEEEEKSWENTVVFCVSCFQYLILGLVYSKGKPHCLPFFTDFWFMLVWSSLFALTTLLCARPNGLLASWFELIPPEVDTSAQSAFRIILLLFPLANFMLSFVIESFVSQRKWFKSLLHFVLRKRKPKNMYKRVLTEKNVWKPGLETAC